MKASVLRRRLWLLAPLLALGAFLFVACGGGSALRDDETPVVQPTLTPDDEQLIKLGFSYEFKTNFDKVLVPLDEIVSGGPSKDGIPPIDEPKFLDLSGGDEFLQSQEPVIALELNGDARAYPLQVLIWHEIVNDTVGGVPVVVTFCPLCNTAIVFERTLDGVVYDFGTTGKLRFSDLIMYDRQTESWWQQITGEAIIGDLVGEELTFLPASIVSWEQFEESFPEGRVLSTDTGHSRPYGSNPYPGYDDINASPFLLQGSPDERLLPMERVAAVSLNGEDVAYPFSVLEKARVVHDTVGGEPVVVVFQPGTVSALDRNSIADSRDVGATGVFSPLLDARALTFRLDGDRIVDQETGSTWNVLGQAIDGPLEGRELAPIIHGNHFWFAWGIFKPDTRIYQEG